MAHFEQLQFFSVVREQFPEFFRSCRVLEVGSWDRNGSVRALFEGCDYVGSDVGPGPGVDIVCPGQDLDMPTGSFDTVVSTECFEHNPYWFETFTNMIRMLKDSGLCIITCATPGRTEHGTRRMMTDSSLSSVLSLPDHYRNLRSSDFLSRMDFATHFGAWGFITNVYHHDLYLLAVKGRKDAAQTIRKVQFVTAAARGIRPASRLSKVAAIAARLSFGARSCLSWLLGERRYHNTEFRVRAVLDRHRSRR